MWMMVMFDLPTETPKQRKSATRFRKFLLDTGFEMVQFSVYVQFVGTFESSQKYVRAIRSNQPEYGDINILFFTDKQFAAIIHLSNRHEEKLKEEPKQFEMFWKKLFFYHGTVILWINDEQNETKNKRIANRFFENNTCFFLKKALYHRQKNANSVRQKAEKQFFF